MKISRRNPVNLPGSVSSGAPAKQKPAVQGETPAPTGATDVNLSPALQEVDRARKAASSLPDVPAEVVQELKPVVDNGSYRRESKVIAKKMVDTSLRESAMLRSRRKK